MRRLFDHKWETTADNDLFFGHAQCIILQQYLFHLDKITDLFSLELMKAEAQTNLLEYNIKDYTVCKIFMLSYLQQPTIKWQPFS